MVADPDPLSTRSTDRSQRAIPVCERGDLSDETLAVSRSKSRTPLNEGQKRSRTVKTHSPVGFQRNGDAVRTADKTKVRRRYPRPCAMSVTLLWARNLTYDVESDGVWGSGRLPNKTELFVVVFSFMMCSSRPRATRVTARTHLNIKYGLSVAVRTRRVV